VKKDYIMNAAQWLNLFTQVNADAAADEIDPVPFNESSVEYYADQMFMIEGEEGEADDYLDLAREMVNLANQQ